jgi:hypothetical protein
MPEVRIGAAAEFPIDKRLSGGEAVMFEMTTPEKGVRRPHKAGSLLLQNPA